MTSTGNLPFESAPSDPLRTNLRLALALLLAGAGLLWLAGTGHPRFIEGAWYHVRFVEGGVFYERMPNEATCRATAVGHAVGCLSGSALGANRSDE